VHIYGTSGKSTTGALRECEDLGASAGFNLTIIIIAGSDYSAEGLKSTVGVDELNEQFQGIWWRMNGFKLYHDLGHRSWLFSVHVRRSKSVEDLLVGMSRSKCLIVGLCLLEGQAVVVGDVKRNRFWPEKSIFVVEEVVYAA
jgi:hypothetical protein